MSNEENIDITGYHQRTKHRFDAYAKGPDTIDWDAQPNPFRQFDGAATVPLPFTADNHDLPFSALFTPQRIPVQPRTLTSIALLLEISLALSAWKQYGPSRWSLRCNPSSGNLHPTEAYLVASGIKGLEDGVYHYRADLHQLEQRCRFTTATEAESGLWLGLSSVHWREAWKYGERAFRYCQHDVGHALAAISYSAATLGWQVHPCYHVGDTALAQLLGLDRTADFTDAEAEYPDLLIQLAGDSTDTANLKKILRRASTGTWSGRANILDRHHFYQWPVIDAVTAASAKPDSAPASAAILSSLPPLQPTHAEEPAARLFRRRRSAQAFDGTTGIAQADFFRILDHLLPRADIAPWNGLPWSPRLHLVLFVHQVEGLAPGVYALPRHPEAETLLRAAFRSSFNWQRVPQAPEHLPLYLLVAANARNAAAKLCCQQSIAGTSAFSLGMVAEFDNLLREAPWRYRELFWEAGAIGQVLYLEAEACGLRGTGIGCYFDDAVHELLGIQDTRLQSLYHFTIGAPVIDNRLITLPPYSRNLPED